MLQTIQQSLAVAAVPRVCLALNHILASESVATERLKPHAGRYVRLHLQGWPSMLPTPPDLVFGITPAGLLEWGGEAPPAAVDLNLTVEASNPLLAALQGLGGERPKVSVDGDAALAADVSWLVDNLRWDIQDDLARVVGDVPAREIARVGGVLAGGLRAAVQGLTGLASRVSAPWRHLARLLLIVVTVLRYGLDELALSGFKQRWVRALVRVITVGRRLDAPRGERLRLALERLGPIFVKFGQVMSTRRDLLPGDLADELARLQDNVPPISAAKARELVEAAYGRPLDEVFGSFEAEPVASASIAQVHFATLKDGRAVAVKVLRPGILAVIDDDLALLRTVARWVERFSEDGKRLKPREVVAEFDNYLHDELDLVREAANAAQLRRNMADLPLILVPEMHWDLCTQTVLVMERMTGVPISQTQRLRDAGVDIPKLARDGVTIFFTQVFRDGFFHADMHPGNIQVSLAPETFGRYIALDFGIVGTLTEVDKEYLAQNFIAFFQRDYKRVAELHVESGWVPPETRINELEGAIRAVCEPHFDRPLKDISLGQVLLRLFQTSRRFNVEIQPQLVLLQKTLLNVEGLGRQLDPELDLWSTAKPFLERWMNEQIGWRGVLARLKKEAPHYAQLLPELPRLIHGALQRPKADAQLQAWCASVLERQQSRRLLDLALGAALGVGLGVIVARWLS